MVKGDFLLLLTAGCIKYAACAKHWCKKKGGGKRSVGTKKKQVGEQGVHGAAAWQQYGSHLRVGSDALQLCCRRAVALLY
jgi:hypothetical protein